MLIEQPLHPKRANPNIKRKIVQPKPSRDRKGIRFGQPLCKPFAHGVRPCRCTRYNSVRSSSLQVSRRERSYGRKPFASQSRGVAVTLKGNTFKFRHSAPKYSIPLSSGSTHCHRHSPTVKKSFDTRKSDNKKAKERN